MFDKKTYVQRRAKLARQVRSGLLLFLGNSESPMNYPANPYHYRQDSTFLYFFGLSHPGLAAVIDLDEGRQTVFGNDVDMEDIIWMGPQPSLKGRCARVGVSDQRPLADLAGVLQAAVRLGRKVHFLPPYRAENAAWLERLLGIRADAARDHASAEFARAVIAQRSLKSAEEVAEIEAALTVSAAMSSPWPAAAAWRSRPSSASTARRCTTTSTATAWPKATCCSSTRAPRPRAATPPTSPAPSPWAAASIPCRRTSTRRCWTCSSAPSP